MQHYFECVGLIPGTLAENEVQPVLDEITGFFNEVEADVVRNELIGRRKMAYPINNMRHAYYFLVGFNIDGKKINDIEKKLKLSSNVMRFLITKNKPKTQDQIQKENERLARQTGEKQEFGDKDKEETQDKIQEQEKTTVVDNISEEKSTEIKEENKSKEKNEPVDLEQLDKKLDEILDEEIK